MHWLTANTFWYSLKRVVEGFQSSPGLTRARDLTRLRRAAGPASLGEASEGLTYREDVGGR